MKKFVVAAYKSDIVLYCMQDKEPKGIIPLENVQVRELSVSGHKPHSFEIHSSGNDVIKACKTDSEGKVVEGICLLLV